MTNAKPRIYWTYYPASRRGYWRVTPTPKPVHRHSKLWARAYAIVHLMNANNEKVRAYRAEYNRELKLRLTT